MTETSGETERLDGSYGVGEGERPTRTRTRPRRDGSRTIERREDAPIPGRCVYLKKDGRYCRRYPHPGAVVCVKHGANAPQVKRAAERRLAALSAEKDARRLGLGQEKVTSPTEAILHALWLARMDVDVWAAIVAELQDPTSKRDQRAIIGVMDTNGPSVDGPAESELPGSRLDGAGGTRIPHAKSEPPPESDSSEEDGSNIPTDVDSSPSKPNSGQSLWKETRHLTGTLTGEYSLHVALEAYERAQKRLADIASAALRAKVQDQQVKLAQDRAHLLTEVLRHLCQSLGHNPADPSVRLAMRQSLQLAAGGDS